MSVPERARGTAKQLALLAGEDRSFGSGLFAGWFTSYRICVGINVIDTLMDYGPPR